MTKNGQEMDIYGHKFSGFFLLKLKKIETEKYVIYVVAFDPIVIQTSLEPQNDHQYLNFVKDFIAGGKKMTRKDHKIAQS